MRIKEAEDDKWVFNSLVKFMPFHLARVNRKEITGATVRNYLKRIKLYYEMADILISWKKSQEVYFVEKNMLMIGSQLWKRFRD